MNDEDFAKPKDKNIKEFKWIFNIYFHRRSNLL